MSRKLVNFKDEKLIIYKKVVSYCYQNNLIVGDFLLDLAKKFLEKEVKQ